MHDAIIIGGGPAGATAALELARRGLSAVVLERATFPRFHVGESFLPRSMAQIEALGLADRLAELPQVPKAGIEFVMGHGDDEPSRYWFSEQLGNGATTSFNIERAPFDAMLLDAAREAGADVRTNVRLTAITRLADDDVAVETDAGPLKGRVLVDASGAATVVGRHLGTRQVIDGLRKVAHFGHHTGVFRADGPEGGFPTIVMCDDAWFWVIPIDETRTSIGLVMDESDARRVPVAADQRLAWAIQRCPVMQERCRHATGPERNGVIADFSYSCRPYAGPGYFLVGDAATFVDPIFSTGVCLGMMSGQDVAARIEAMLRHAADPADTRRAYARFVEGSTASFFEFVRMYYTHPFRELFLHGAGPLGVHKALLALLAGDAFPKPPRSVRWRLSLFRLFNAMQRVAPLVPRRAGFRLTERNEPVDAPRESALAAP